MAKVRKDTQLLLDFVERYGPKAGREGPQRFVREVLGVIPDPWQDKILGDVGAGERRIAVRSCHGPGKTAVAAWLTCMMLLTRYPQKTVATAPTSSQLQGALVPEVQMWMNRLPPALKSLFDIKAGGIYLRADPASSFFEARTSRQEQPEALQGIHSDNVLLIGDEASAIPEAIFRASVGSMSSDNSTMLLIGNPVRTSGYFFDAFHANKHLWKTYRVSHTDSPRVTDDFVRMIREQDGEDSAEFRIRCLGEFPLSDVDTVIPYDLVESAIGRDIQEDEQVVRVWGLDVARFGDDKVALTERTPRTARVLDVWQRKDLMATTGRVKARWDEEPMHRRPQYIFVDSIGLGSGVVDRLKELNMPARGINVAEAAALSDRFTRARSELWWRARDWLAGLDVRLEPPKDPRNKEDPQNMLAAELVVPKYKHSSAGKIEVEPKSETKKWLRRSPDVADSFILTFARDLAKVKYGTKGAAQRDEPIKRNLSVV